MTGGMIGDFHTHILPGVDDGSESTEQSLQMLGMLWEQGVRRVVATPHFYASHDTPERFLQRRDGAWAKLRGAMTSHTMPQIYLGAEVHYFEGISDCEALSRLAIGETGCVLVEMPSRSWSERMLRELQEIRHKQGLTPVVAHIDRYLSPWGTGSVLRELSQMPVLIQANASFFLNRSSRWAAMRLLRAGEIHLLGSDCHNTSHRPPNLGQAAALIRRKLGQQTLDALIQRENSLLGL